MIRSRRIIRSMEWTGPAAPGGACTSPATRRVLTPAIPADPLCGSTLDDDDQLLLDHRPRADVGKADRRRGSRKPGKQATVLGFGIFRPSVPPRVEAALTVAVAPRHPIGRAPQVPCTDQHFDISCHDELQYPLGHGAEKVRVASLRQQFNQQYSSIGHRDSCPLG